ncbi:MAG: L-2-hydroxyglutarate oxidase [Candidatus Fonsibacter sp.]
MNVLIIGSGIVGLTTAIKLKKKDKNLKISILEKENSSTQHGSGRNSGIIHSGVYYPPNTLKAKLCVNGSRQLKNYVKDKKLWIDECGKILIPTSKETVHNLDVLLHRARENSVEAELISNSDAEKLEPNINSDFDKAIFIPFTSIVSPKEVMTSLIKDFSEIGGVINYNEEVINIDSKQNKILTRKNSYNFDYILNCSGLHADTIAKSAGLDFDYSFLPFKGKYWKIKKNYKLNRLIYPIPDLNFPFLGVHTAHNKSNEVFLGPTSTPVFGRESYSFWNNFKLSEISELLPSFLYKIIKNQNNLRNLAFREIKMLTKQGLINEIKKIIKNVEVKDLVYYEEKTGIRSQIFDNKSENLINDFVVKKFNNNQLHVLNAVSPAFTASFAFADYLISEMQI